MFLRAVMVTAQELLDEFIMQSALWWDRSVAPPLLTVLGVVRAQKERGIKNGLRGTGQHADDDSEIETGTRSEGDSDVETQRDKSAEGWRKETSAGPFRAYYAERVEGGERGGGSFGLSRAVCNACGQPLCRGSSAVALEWSNHMRLGESPHAQLSSRSSEV